VTTFKTINDAIQKTLFVSTGPTENDFDWFHHHATQSIVCLREAVEYTDHKFTSFALGAWVHSFESWKRWKIVSDRWPTNHEPIELGHFVGDSTGQAVAEICLKIWQSTQESINKLRWTDGTKFTATMHTKFRREVLAKLASYGVATIPNELGKLRSIVSMRLSQELSRVSTDDVYAIAYSRAIELRNKQIPWQEICDQLFPGEPLDMIRKGTTRFAEKNVIYLWKDETKRTKR